jgi:hypothetical protein
MPAENVRTHVCSVAHRPFTDVVLECSASDPKHLRMQKEGRERLSFENLHIVRLMI